jgi:hypothetical protein
MMIGNECLDEKKFLDLEEPSIIFPTENNYILNPLHPDIRQIEIGELQGIPFGPVLPT